MWERCKAFGPSKGFAATSQFNRLNGTLVLSKTLCTRPMTRLSLG
jgi:hypothetical protein